jgi:hypothetical protein
LYIEKEFVPTAATMDWPFLLAIRKGRFGMRLDVRFDNGFEKLLASFVIAAALAAVFMLGYLISPGAAYAEWDSSSSFGDSYYLRQIADNIDDATGELSEISSTLDDIERSMP